MGQGHLHRHAGTPPSRDARARRQGHGYCRAGRRGDGRRHAQTIEAIHHAKAAHVPLIVAITRSTSPTPSRSACAHELLQHEVQVESLGGERSKSKSRQAEAHLDKLARLIALQAEVLDLKANATVRRGTVIEARLRQGRGPVATVLVSAARCMSAISSSPVAMGPLRALLDARASASRGSVLPVEILGFSGTRRPATAWPWSKTKPRARVTESRASEARETPVRGGSARSSLSDMNEPAQDRRPQGVPAGRSRATCRVGRAILARSKSSTPTRCGARRACRVGGISESDISLAEASGRGGDRLQRVARIRAREARALGIEIAITTSSTISSTM